MKMGKGGGGIYNRCKKAEDDVRGVNFYIGEEETNYNLKKKDKYIRIRQCVLSTLSVL